METEGCSIVLCCLKTLTANKTIDNEYHTQYILSAREMLVTFAWVCNLRESDP